MHQWVRLIRNEIESGFFCENSLWAKYCVFCNAIKKIQVSCSFLSTLYALRQFERSKNLTFGFLFELVFQSLLSIFIFNISVSFTLQAKSVECKLTPPFSTAITANFSVTPVKFSLRDKPLFAQQNTNEYGWSQLAPNI